MTIRGSLQDQPALHDTLRSFLVDRLPPDELRSMLDNEPGYSPELHVRLCREEGLAGLTLPAEFGGRGMSLTEACAVHSELGRALYPGPYLPSCVAAAALLATGDHEACQRWLPLLADGSVIGTMAAADDAGHWAAGPDGIRAEYATGGWRLYGRRWYVIAAHVADIVVVPAMTESGLAMFLAESGFAGLTVSRQLDLDLTRRISITTFDAVPARLLTPDADAALARAQQEFLIATTAEAAGGIGWCLDASITYVKEREQFGPSTGSFKAVAQSCVDMLADLQSVSAAARYAAIATAAGSNEAPKAAHIAALRAGEAYRKVIDAAIHLFGGAGFAQADDAQLYYRRAWSAERLAGGPQAHRAAIAEL